MVINETTEQGWAQGSKTRSDPPPGDQYSFQLQRSTSRCVLHVLFFTFSVFVGSFPSGTVPSTSTTVQTAEIEHDCVASSICF